MLISSFLPSEVDSILTKALNSQAEGRYSLRQAILYDYNNNKSNKKSVKETVPPWGQNWLLVCNTIMVNSPLKLPRRVGNFWNPDYFHTYL